jgi:hypothetical protein
MLANIAQGRFPALLSLAQQQSAQIDDLQTLQQVVLNLALASTEEDARQALLS